jgi:hypothetical protein
MPTKPTIALSVIQPWAWLLVNGYKDVENRTWKKPDSRFPNGYFPDQCLIHAGQKFDKDGYLWVKKAFPEIPLPRPEEFQRGGIVGQVDFTGCVTKMESRWFFGRYGYTTRDGKPLPFRACRGQLGFFEPDYSAQVAAPKPLAKPRAPKGTKAHAEAEVKTALAGQQQAFPGME